MDGECKYGVLFNAMTSANMVYLARTFGARPNFYRWQKLQIYQERYMQKYLR